MRQSRPVLQGSEKWKWLIIQAEAYLLWVAIMLQKERSVPKQLGSSRCLNTLQKMPFVPKRAKWYSNLRTGTTIILVNGIFLCSNAVLASDTSQSKYLLKTTLSLDSFLDLERREKKRQCKMLCDVCPCCHFSSSWGLKRCWQAGLLWHHPLWWGRRWQGWEKSFSGGTKNPLDFGCVTEGAGWSWNLSLVRKLRILCQKNAYRMIFFFF